jgi:hypothetical protein
MDTTYNCHYRTCSFVGILESERYREKYIEGKMFFMQRRERREYIYHRSTTPSSSAQSVSLSVNMLTLAIRLPVADLTLYVHQIIN